MALAQPPEAFQWDGSWFGHPGTELIDSYAGTSVYRALLGNRSLTAEEVYGYFQPEARAFRETRRPYLLYKE